LRSFEGISLQQLGAGVGLPEYRLVAPQIVQGLLQALVALLLNDLASEGLAALPNTVHIFEFRQAEGFLLLDDVLLLDNRILLLCLLIVFEVLLRVLLLVLLLLLYLTNMREGACEEGDLALDIRCIVRLKRTLHGLHLDFDTAFNRTLKLAFDLSILDVEQRKPYRL
jgi:hypothetical protein